MDDHMTDVTKEAVQAGIDSFLATAGHFPDQFKLLLDHAPGAFAGYGLMRSALMQERPAGALDMKTKELIFALLDVLAADRYGALSHGRAAIKLGLTVPELAEGLVQVIMVGGITTWNLVGADLLRACIEQAEAKT
jgi:alkylhydroperoxidase/carboxymuconolactone decarboxylase family protein YurZ